MLKIKRNSVTFVFLFLITSINYAQCAMCRAVLESEEGQKTAESINNGIIYLMILPYILVAGVGYFVYKKLKTK